MKLLLLALLLSPLLLAAGALLLNRAPLFAEPGLWPRLKLYLSQNVAQTTPQHAHPELRSPMFAVDANKASVQGQRCMQELGWRNVREVDGVTQGEVVTALWRFTDDVELRWQPVDKGLRADVVSRSRVGKADFAANQRHVVQLLNCLERRLGDLSPRL